ncbi:DUF3606 domain-containing protein [Candidatus Sororendozoicomonas aggregata]|uniref:DUF3606 domain-containing protein n=1 Tax=Candidatus Sororendozoicomonas aggregata TaxID=3073239 RepID=UPI002ED4982E
MPDSLKITQPLDAKRINVNQHYEVEYWCRVFNCSEQELKDAIAAVGDSAKNVDRHLRWYKKEPQE